MQPPHRKQQNPSGGERGGRAASGSHSRRTCCRRGCRARQRPGWPARCARAASRTTRRSRASAPGRPAAACTAAPRPTPCPAGLLGVSAQAGLHCAPQRPAVQQQESAPRRPATQWWSMSGLPVKSTQGSGLPCVIQQCFDCMEAAYVQPDRPSPFPRLFPPIAASAPCATGKDIHNRCSKILCEP